MASRIPAWIQRFLLPEPEAINTRIDALNTRIEELDRRLTTKIDEMEKGWRLRSGR